MSLWRDVYKAEPRPPMSEKEWPAGHVAPLLVYLASDEASDINGQLFTCGGGQYRGAYGAWQGDAEVHKSVGRWTQPELD